MSWTRRARRLVVAVMLTSAACTGLAACSSPDRTPTIPTPSAPPSAASTTTVPTACTTKQATATFAPYASTSGTEAFPANSLQNTIRNRKRLVVGISADTRLLGSRNLLLGQFEGFDIAVAREVAKAIFGTDTGHITFKAINAAQRIPLVTQGADAGGVDMVARAMTVTCDRWKQVDFSNVYLLAHQKVLVRAGSPATTFAALDKAKARVCATAGSTSIAKLKDYPGITAVPVALTTDCLVRFQQGQVDAITGDDAILAGLAEQDPAAVVSKDQPSVEDEPYALAVSQKHSEFVRYVNAVLERMRRDGTWQRLYSASPLSKNLGPQDQPAPNYTRPLPS